MARKKAASWPQFTKADKRAIEVAAQDVGIPVDLALPIVLTAPGLDPEDIISAAEGYGYEPAAHQFVSNLIGAGILFDLSTVPPAEPEEDEDEAPAPVEGTTTSELLSGLE